MSSNLDVAQNRIINDIIQNITTVTHSTQTSEQLNYLSIILQGVSFVAIGAFGLLLKVLYSRITDKLFSKQMVIPERKEGSITIPSRVVDSDGKTLEERLETRVKNTFDSSSGEIKSELRNIKSSIITSHDFFTRWNQRIEDVAKEASKKTETVDNKIDEFKVKFAEHMGYSKTKDEEMERRLNMLEQLLYGTKAKSQPKFIIGEDETEEHDLEEGHGLFKDTEEESEERKTENKS